ncbi:MAG: hypothetical protein AB8H80_15130 [Planctomycetota bacterium]
MRKLVSLVSVLLVSAAMTSCGTVRSWRELKTEPMSIGAAWNGFVQIVTARDGWLSDQSVTDQGLGIWQSRWKKREMERNFPIRNRFYAEFLLDEGSREDGWLIRYYVEQEKCKDLRRHAAPSEEDWSKDGQDQEAETILGQRLIRRLAPKSVEVLPPERR